MDYKERYAGCILPVVDENLNIFLESSVYDMRNEQPYKVTQVDQKDNFYDCFKDLIGYELYYSFQIADYEDEGKVKRFHAESFEYVIRELYLHPESFALDKEDIQNYSRQQLVFLNRLKRFLKIGGLKDVKDYSVEEIMDRVKTPEVQELLEYKLYNVPYAKKIVDGIVKSDIRKYIDFKFEPKEKLLVSTLREDFIAIVEADRVVMSLDDVTEDMIDYIELGFDTFEDYKEDLISKINASDFKFGEDNLIVYETFNVIKKINS